MTKLLYIGAGLDLNPLIHFTKTKEFIFVDTLPRSSFDYSYEFNNNMYMNTFISILLKKLSINGFELETSYELEPNYFTKIMSYVQRLRWIGRVKYFFPYICPYLIIFYNYKTGQKLKYYISTNIQFNMCLELEKDLKSIDGLVISGYHPNNILLNYIKEPINLYCYNKTAYKLNNEEVDNIDNIIYWLFNNLDKVQYYFNNIYVCDENGIIIKSDDLEHMNNIVINNHS